MEINESNDISDTAQVAVFGRAINDKFDVSEELLGLKSLHSTSKESDLLETLRNLGEKNNMEWAKLVCICKDGAPAMMGCKSGCLTLLEQYIDRTIFKYHCILHYEALCWKKLNLKNVMDVVIRCINKILSSSLNRQEFRQFLSDMNEEYGEILQHCEVRWLSKGKVLSHFWALKKSVYLFLSETEELQTEREYILNGDWLNNLAFMVDITSHLNCLNERLQGKDKLFTNLCDEVTAFKMKLRLFIKQFTEGILDVFSNLRARLLEKTFNVLQYQIKLESLLEAFESRFDEFEKRRIMSHSSQILFCFLKQRFITYMNSFN